MKGNIIIGALVLGVCLGLCGCRAPVGTTGRHAEAGPALWHRGDGLHFGKLEAKTVAALDAQAAARKWQPLEYQTVDVGGNLTAWALSRVPLSTVEEAAAAVEEHKNLQHRATLSAAPPALDAVFRRMVQALPGTFRPAAFTFSLEIVEDPLPNAFTCGGGKVFVTSGMVRLLEIDGTLQQEVAAMLLAHELGHISLRHCARGYQLRKLIAAVGEITARTAYGAATIITLNAASQLAPFLYTREQEFEADIFALHLCRNAGVNLDQALNLYRGIARAFSDAPPSSASETTGFYFLTAHPEPLLRLKWLNMERTGQPSGNPFGLFAYNRQKGQLQRAQAAPGSLDRALVFVHGMEGSANTFAHMADWASKQMAFREYNLYFLIYPNDDSLAKSAIFLRKEILRVGGPTACPSFVCHSAGGLVFRLYAEKLGGAFARSFMIGTPQHGSDMAVLRIFLEVVEMCGSIALPGGLSGVLAPYADGRGQIMHDLTPDSLLLNYLGETVPWPAKYEIVSGKALNPLLAGTFNMAFLKGRRVLQDRVISQVTAPALRQLLQDALSKVVIPDELLDGDGAVTTQRAQLPGVRVHTLKGNHVGLTSSPDVMVLMRKHITGQETQPE